MSTGLLTNLSKLDVWLLARCAVGYRAEPQHMKDATVTVGNLLRYLDGLNYRDRDVIMSQQLSLDDYKRVTGADPESPCPIIQQPDRNWTIIHASKLKELPPVKWLVKGEIPEAGLVVLFGQSGAGKSFLSLDYALNLAQSAPVVYIAGEGEWGYPQRVGAWCKHHQKNEGQLYICLGAVNLYEPEDFNAFITQIAKYQPVLTVVDTLAMCMAGANENDTRDMGLVIKACKQIQRQLECAVMIVHHVSKGGIAERGSSALRGAADTMIKVSPMDDVVAIESSKTKDVAGFPTRYIRLLPVELGVDEDGNAVTSVVCVPSEKVIQSKDDALTNNQRKVLEALAMEVFTDGASLGDIAEITEIGRGNVWKIVSRLISMEHVSKGGGGYKITERGRAAIGLPASTDSSASTDSVTPSKILNPFSKTDGVSGVSGVRESVRGKNGHSNGVSGVSAESDDDEQQLTFDEMVGAAKPKRNSYQAGM